MPIYRQVIDQIRLGIASGQLKLGEQLPTVRALAVELKVNLNTVSKAYKELEVKNVLETQQGAGTLGSYLRHIGFSDPHCRPMGTGGGVAYGKIQWLKRAWTLSDYPYCLIGRGMITFY